MPRALITGVTGQDGWYLSKLLLGKGYEVHGLVRGAARNVASGATGEVTGLGVRLHRGDLTDGASLGSAVSEARPDEVYHLAAHSDVAASFERPEATVEVNALGTLRLLEVLRRYQERSGVRVRFFQAGSAAVFGTAPPPQSEATPFAPRSPYAAAKAMAHHLVATYRERYGLHASNGILFNHESERRPETVLTRKVTRAAARIRLGLQGRLALGNLDARRDWGHAEDHVRAMWLMLQQDAPDDYVVATGRSTTVRGFVSQVFARLGLDWQDYVDVDPSLSSSAQDTALEGDASKARSMLGWQARVGLDELIERMLNSDLQVARREKASRDAPNAEAPRGTTED